MNTFVTFLVMFFGVIFAMAGVLFYVWMFLMYVRMARDVHKISIGDIHDEFVVDKDGNVVTDKKGNPKLKWLECIFTRSFYKSKRFWLKVALPVVVVAAIIACGCAITKYIAYKNKCKAEEEYMKKLEEVMDYNDKLILLEESTGIYKPLLPLPLPSDYNDDYSY